MKDELKEAKKNSNKDNSYRPHINASRHLLDNMPHYLAHTVDFSLFHEEAVMNFAESMAQYNQVAGIVNSTFLAQIKAAMVARKKKNEYCESLSLELCNKLSLEQLKELKGST